MYKKLRKFRNIGPLELKVKSWECYSKGQPIALVTLDFSWYKLLYYVDDYDEDAYEDAYEDDDECWATYSLVSSRVQQYFDMLFAKVHIDDTITTTKNVANHDVVFGCRTLSHVSASSWCTTKTICSSRNRFILVLNFLFFCHVRVLVVFFSFLGVS